MKVTIDCSCGEKLETSTVYDFRLCMKCGKSHSVKSTGDAGTVLFPKWDGGVDYTELKRLKNCGVPVLLSPEELRKCEEA